jgi:predicted kinase
MLIIFAGLPGTGKSSIARALASKLDCLWLRIDSIEEALRESGALKGDVDGAGYMVAYRVAEDNLLLGRTVIADSVNPWTLTRNAWREVGVRAGVGIFEVETICSDQEEHRRRIETRGAQVRGAKPLSWRDVVERDYQPWDRDHLTIDTGGQTLEGCVERVCVTLSGHIGQTAHVTTENPEDRQ